jgi:hypothetical protein
VSEAINQSNSWPVQKSSTFTTTAACCTCSSRALYPGGVSGLAGSSQDPRGRRHRAGPGRASYQQRRP